MIIAYGIYSTNKIIMLSIILFVKCISLFPVSSYPLSSASFLPLFRLLPLFLSLVFPFFTVRCVSNMALGVFCEIRCCRAFPSSNGSGWVSGRELAQDANSVILAMLFTLSPCLSFLIRNDSHVTCQMTCTPVRRALGIVTGQHLTFITN